MNPYSAFPFLGRRVSILFSFIMLAFVYVAMQATFRVASLFDVGFWLFDFNNYIFNYRASDLCTYAAMISYILICLCVIPANKVGIQTCMGRIVEGGEMSPGLHLLPVIPVPFLGFICALLSVSYPLGYGVLKTDDIAEKQKEIKKTLNVYTKEGVQLVLSFVFQFTTNRAQQEIMGASVASEFVNRALTLFSDSSRDDPQEYRVMCQKEVHMPAFVLLAESMGITLQSIFIEHVGFANKTAENMFEQLLASKVSEEELLRRANDIALLKRTLGEGYTTNDVVMLYIGYGLANK